METQPQVSFRNMKPSETLREIILAEIDDLQRFYDKITGCRVVVEAPQHHLSRKGNLYRVTLDILVPGKEIVVVEHDIPQEHFVHESVDSVIRSVFDTGRRQLSDLRDLQRGYVKVHEDPKPMAKVVKRFEDRDFGFLKTPDDREIYFHRNSIINGTFEDLDPGTLVRFVEVQGANGPQASTVEVIGGLETEDSRERYGSM